MSMQAWVEPFMITGEDGTALANSTTPTSILPAARKPIIPSAFFDAVGKAFRLEASGRISTVVTTPGTLTLTVRFGSIDVFSSGAMSLNTTAQTNVAWFLEVDMILRALGSGTSANMMGQGKFRSHAVIGSPAPTAGGAGVHLLPYNAAPAVGSGFDCTASQQVDLFATWSVANASNSIQTHIGKLFSLN